MSFNYKTIRHLSLKKKMTELEKLTLQELKDFLTNYKIPFPKGKKATKEALLKIILAKT